MYRNLLVGSRSTGPVDVHRDTLRIFCVLAGMLNPLFGAVYRITDPTAFDPLSARFGLAVIALFLLSLSYMHAWVRDHFIGLVQAYFYLLIVYLVGLTALNSFSPNYTLGLMFAITAVGVAFSLGLRKRLAPLRSYLAFAVLLTVPAGLMVHTPQVSTAILWICAFSTSIVIYVGALAKIKAEDSVEESEQRYHTLMSAASDAIFISDPGTGMLIDANQKAQELVGRSLDEIQRMRTAELFPLEGRDRFNSLFEVHVFEKKPIAEDLFVAHRSGECIPIDVSASLVDVGGRKFIQGIFRRHRYEQQLIQAKERAEELLHLKTSLLNNMSHELRTPLTSILGYAEMLNDRGGNPHECAQVIITSAKRLHETLNSILGLAQLESGVAHLDLKVLDVASQVQECLSLLKPLADAKKLDLRALVLCPQVFAVADEICLNRIVNNLVGNAIKFTEVGYVALEIDADEHWVFLRVRDSGIGISTSFLPHLFHEFRQESTGLSRSYEGNGLGLAITKRLVDLLKGTITVESKKGDGTVFTVALPRVLIDSEQGGASGTPAAANGGPRKKLLVVEDNADTRNLVFQRMSEYFNVDTASDPETALRMATDTRYHAFVLDINLGAPRDGVDVLQSLRGMPQYGKTPMVALTAFAMPGDKEHFLGKGFDHYLSKPFTKEQLLQVTYLLLKPERGDPSLASSQASAWRS